MIFCGDTACPEERIDSYLSDISEMDIFNNEIVVFNLEGNIIENNSELNRPGRYNAPKIVKAFPKAKKVIACLANNHMYDYPERIVRTTDILKENNIGYFGLKDDDGNNLPYEFSIDGIDYALFGHCWKLYTITNPNNMNDIRIVDSDYDIFIDEVRDYISNHIDTRVYCFMHWNYDLEHLPFPMHRKISKALIDIGVKGVIGGHSHVPQGVELYKDCPIVYGLGNFYIPSGIFFDGELSYSDNCKKSYIISIKDEDSKIIWLKTDLSSNKAVCLDGVENIDGDRIKSFSDCLDNSDKEYKKYFRKFRTKRLLVPIFLIIVEKAIIQGNGVQFLELRC